MLYPYLETAREARRIFFWANLLYPYLKTAREARQFFVVEILPIDRGGPFFDPNCYTDREKAESSVLLREWFFQKQYLNDFRNYKILKALSQRDAAWVIYLDYFTRKNNNLNLAARRAAIFFGLFCVPFRFSLYGYSKMGVVKLACVRTSARQPAGR